MTRFKFRIPTVFLLLASAGVGLSSAAEPNHVQSLAMFEPADVFQLEYASDPQISPDGTAVAYVRNSMDIMTDKARPRLWLATSDGSEHRPLTDWDAGATSPRWSPDGKRLAYVAKSDKATQIFVRWIDTGQTARLTNLSESPHELCWSPDGKWLAFSMLVLEHPEPYAPLPKKPEGAEWAKPFKMIDTLVYRSDGEGYLKDGYLHLFVLPAEGGTARQLTHGPFHHPGRVAWSADGKSLYFSTNRRADWEHEPLNSDLYRITIGDRSIVQVTDRRGPDQQPVVSDDGKLLAFVGYDDAAQSYHQNELYSMAPDGSERKCLTTEFDRDVEHPRFSHDGQGIYFQYDDQGNTKVGYVSLESGKIETLAENVGGTTLDRPYASGSFSVSDDGRVTFTTTSTSRPADVAISTGEGNAAVLLTHLNDDLLEHKQLARVESFWFTSSYDEQKIQGWIASPPGFDSRRKYPLILEIHGGPFANYGGRFSADVQLYAAAGYLVLYVNPRGSTSYGDKFTDLINHNYPSQDFDDLMSAVDFLISRGHVDPQKLYVTGGSGGGILSSWIVGKTNRFQSAAVIKPVVNWYSFALTSDHYNFFARYWFGKNPWEDPEAYLKRSPLSLVGNVTTPTMLMTGEEDYRTPISEAEQFYQALKLRKIDTVLVRVPGSSHNIAARPSHLIAHAAYVLKWFETHSGKPDMKVNERASR